MDVTTTLFYIRENEIDDTEHNNIMRGMIRKNMIARCGGVLESASMKF
jgi:hypothetical protein